MTSSHVLALGIATHAVYGAVLAAAIFLVGSGLERMLAPPRPDRPEPMLSAIFVYGISGLSMAGYASLWGAITASLAAVSAIGAAAYGAQGIRRRELAAAALRGSVRALPWVLLAAVLSGIYFHGPMQGVNGSPVGDQVWYAARIMSIAQAPWVRADLLAEGLNNEWFWSKNIPLVLGAPFAGAELLEPFLFLAVSMPLCCGLWLAALLRAEAEKVEPDLLIAVCAGGLVGLAPSQYWSMIDSPPMTIVLPLAAIGSMFLTRRESSLPIGVIFAGLTAAICLETKPPAAIFFAPFLGLLLLRQIDRALGRRAAFAIGVAGALAVLTLFGLLLKANPGYVRTHHIGLEALFAFSLPNLSEQWGEGGLAAVLPPLLKLPLGILAFGMAASWRKPDGIFRIAVVIAIAAALVANLTIPSAATIATRCVIAFLGFSAFALRPSRWWSLALFAATLLGTAVQMVHLSLSTILLSDGLTMIFCAGTIASVLSLPARAAALAGWSAIVPGTAVIGIFLALVGTQWGADRSSKTMQLSAATWDVWRQARLLIPPDGLIFTDQTGREFDRNHAWNAYALFGVRQTWISDWYDVPALSFDAERLKRQLLFNDGVLDGVIAPDCLPLHRLYSGYFALVSHDRTHPDDWEPIYRNDEFGLYQISTTASPAPGPDCGSARASAGG
ncbi:MAG: hypothetical protein JWL84_6528 [Rhodospirillales bacterium]|nr:hypothetical protein [Rhodospirillales bacterium]